MAVYTLAPGEKTILKESRVKSGDSIAAYTDDLVLTTYRLLNLKVDIFNNYYDVITYPVKDISEVKISKSMSDELRLEFQCNGKVIAFSFQNANERGYRTWVDAINSCDKEEAKNYSENNHSYSEKKVDSQRRMQQKGYNAEWGFLESTYIAEKPKENNSYQTEKRIDPELKTALKKTSGAINDFCIEHDIDKKFVGEVAKNVIKSGKLTPGSIIKSVIKAKSKQAVQGIKDEIGITELEEEFRDLKEEIKEEFNFKNWF